MLTVVTSSAMISKEVRRARLLLVNAFGPTCAMNSRTQVYPQQVGVVHSKYGIAHELIHAKNLMICSTTISIGIGIGTDCRAVVVAVVAVDAVDAAALNRSGGGQRRRRATRTMTLRRTLLLLCCCCSCCCCRFLSRSNMYS